MILHYKQVGDTFVFEEVITPSYPIIYYTDKLGNKWSHNGDEGYFECVTNCGDTEFKNIMAYQSLTNCICEFRDKVDNDLMDKPNINQLTQSIYIQMETENAKLSKLEEIVYSTEEQLYELMSSSYTIEGYKY